MKFQERVALVLTVSMVPLVAMFTWIYSQQQDLFLHWEEMEFVQFLLKVLGMTLILCVIKYFLEIIFRGAGRILIPPEKVATHKFEDKCSRLAACWSSCLYYIASTFIGWYILKDKAWSPAIIIPGASGNIDNCWTGFYDQKIDSDVSFYYILSASWTLCMLSFHLIYKHRRDFLEMIIHHYATLWLIIFSYFTLNIRIGTLVLFVHDICDIWVASARSLADTKYEITSLVLFLLLLASWAFYRLYLFPFHIISSCLTGVNIPSPPVPGRFTLIIMQFVLVVLHIFWFIMLLKIGYAAATEGDRSDKIDCIRDEKGGEKKK